MRSRRLSFVVGWSAVALLAIAGFAAFGDPDPTVQEVQVEAAAASMGHTSGAYAGLAFTLLGPPAQSSPVVDNSGDPDPLTVVPAAEQDDVTTGDEHEETSTGTIASPTSGWLSEVEVRALISLYFQPEDVNRAIRVAWCESRFDPQSVDLRTGGVGLFHHLPRYWDERAASAGFTGADPTEPEASTAAAAWAIYKGGGWDVFTCRG